MVSNSVEADMAKVSRVWVESMETTFLIHEDGSVQIDGGLTVYPADDLISQRVRKALQKKGTETKMTEKVIENKIRRALSRREMWLSKCSARDKGHIHYGLYRVIRKGGHYLKIDGIEWNSLDTIAEWMKQTAEKKETANANG